jgi:alpha-D-xyloside xylohydrolase
MATVTVEQGRLVRRAAGETLILEAWGENALRVRATFDAELPREDWALLPQPEEVRAAASAKGRSGSITCGGITATLGPGGDIHFYDRAGQCFLREQWRDRGELDGHGLYDVTSALRIPGRHFLPHPGGDYRLAVRFEPNAGEKIFGMGQYQDGCLDKMGTTLELAHRNSQASVPFFISNKGYGMLWNNPAIGRVTFAKNTTEWVAEATRAMDYWITVGDTPAQIEEQYTAAVGRAPMMPDYAMGFWQCKLRYMAQDELLAVAREHKRRGLPMSVIVCDFFHWPYQGDWKFDPAEWPDPKAMVDELAALGIELMVSVWPYVDTRSENYPDMHEQGLLARVERGVPVSMLGFGNTLPFDPTNPKARGFVWNVVKRNYYDLGIRVFWLDEAEPECHVYDFDNYRYHAGSVMRVGNLYPVRYAQTFYDGLRAAGEALPLNLLRCAWAGSARYGALVWSGDIGTTFETLRQQLAAGLSMAVAGIPW